MTSYISAMYPTPEEMERPDRDFQKDPTLDPRLGRWLNEHEPTWRDPALSWADLQATINRAREAIGRRPRRSP